MTEPSYAALPDGRRIAYQDGGDPDGYPVIGLHGTPGCRLARWPDDGLYARAGVRYVTTDRAGYGRSTRHPGRSVADAAADVLAVADALGWSEFAVVGGSGGGPHALACAALLGPLGRVVRVACQSSIAPVGVGGMPRRQWLAGMATEEADELMGALEGEEVLVPRMERVQRDMEAALDGDPATLMGDAVSETDVAFLSRPDLVDNWRRIVAEQAAHGVWGSVDDTLAFSRAWGFNLASIDVPVLLTHGAHDLSAPIAHGRWLAARIRSVQTEFSTTGGHLPEDPESEITATMRWLRG